MSFSLLVNGNFPKTLNIASKLEILGTPSPGVKPSSQHPQHPQHPEPPYNKDE
jgi:hypothetical protein